MKLEGRSLKGAGRMVLGDIVRDGLIQHFLLVFVQVYTKFLKRYDRGIVRRIITPDVLFGDAAGLYS
jgi:3-oxoacyl-[acyl-carrier-protein] synthase III